MGNQRVHASRYALLKGNTAVLACRSTILSKRHRSDRCSQLDAAYRGLAKARTEKSAVRARIETIQDERHARALIAGVAGERAKRPAPTAVTQRPTETKRVRASSRCSMHCCRIRSRGLVVQCNQCNQCKKCKQCKTVLAESPECKCGLLLLKEFLCEHCARTKRPPPAPRRPSLSATSSSRCCSGSLRHSHTGSSTSCRWAPGQHDLHCICLGVHRLAHGSS